MEHKPGMCVGSNNFLKQSHSVQLKSAAGLANAFMYNAHALGTLHGTLRASKLGVSTDKCCLVSFMLDC